VAGETRSTVLIWVVAAALAIFAATRLLGGHGAHPAPVRIDGGLAAAGSAPPSRRSADDAEVYVHVAGAVRSPGLIRLPPDSRVAVALERAGGPAPHADLTLVNLAAKVQDGQQIVVPKTGRGGAAVGAAGGGASGAGLAAVPGAKVHLSTATADQLDEIDGIGPTLAGRIVEYRDAHGGFRSIDQLAQVDGIGEKRLTTLRDALQP
jgi:competence protein ComEA